MKREKKIAELRELIIALFETEDVLKANGIKESIYNEVLARDYPKGASKIIPTSMEIWKVDVSNYLTNLSEKYPDKAMKHKAFVALMGIVNLVEFSKEE